MNVYLTFDIEVWCNGWNKLDEVFPASFERYVYGKSSYGDFALPKTLEILDRHKLKGVFFVEPLFATRFGVEHLRTIVELIRAAGQEVQLHLHPEWTDEALEPLIENCAVKRQHLPYYTLDEQTSLIAHGMRLLEAAGAASPTVFRSGGFAANRDTFSALKKNGILLDTSLNRCYEISAPEVLDANPGSCRFIVGGVTTYPVTIIRDGFGKDRPAQVGACGYAELTEAVLNASESGMRDFVIVSHNFEMLRPDSTQPDWIVVERFSRLCKFLAQNSDSLTVRSFGPEPLNVREWRHVGTTQPSASFGATAWRHAEQVRRRLY